MSYYASDEQEDYHRYLALQDADRVFSAYESAIKELDRWYQREAELQKNLDEAKDVIQQLIDAFDSVDPMSVPVCIHATLERARKYMNAG
jgi:hypothetical protein